MPASAAIVARNARIVRHLKATPSATYKSTAESFGVSKQTIARIAFAAGLPMRRPGGPKRPAIEDAP